MQTIELGRRYRIHLRQQEPGYVSAGRRGAATGGKDRRSPGGRQLQRLKWPGAVETPLPRNKPDDREAQERDGREKSERLTETTDVSRAG